MEEGDEGRREKRECCEPAAPPTTLTPARGAVTSGFDLQGEEGDRDATMSAARGISSSSSVAQPPPATAPVDSDDLAWSHCTLPDTNRKHSLKCNYCDKVCTSGITRIKLHLACIKKSGVAPCPKVPSDVKDEMLALLLKKDESNQKKANELEKIRGEVDLDHSEGESLSEDDGNEVIVLKSRKGTSSSTCGPIEKFCKPSVEVSVKKNSLSQKVQTKLSTQKRQERRDRACGYICQFFYEANIPHNTVTLPSFAENAKWFRLYEYKMAIFSRFFLFCRKR
ncbi:hypothetical protein ACQ4PT_069303 [Festuca glaucescens]